MGSCDSADLVVVSAGEDKKISLWHKNGQSSGTIPVAGTDSGDNIERGRRSARGHLSARGYAAGE